ncbi:MAG: hypothetical protein K5639_05035 [Eubacterium sp.]|nr:hypothetical protein [Eubacterium sp.]
MKLKSGRRYKHDLSDVLGILAEHEKKKNPISLEMIKKAAIELYSDWNKIPDLSRNFVEKVMKNGHYIELFDSTAFDEDVARNALIEFEQHYPNEIKQSNLDDILKTLNSKK